MEKLVHYLLLSMFLFATSILAADNTVGLVLDLQGKATLKNSEGQAPLAILSYLTDGSEIVLGAGSKLTVTHYKQKNQQSFTGPAKLSIKADGIKVTEGSAGKSTSLADTQIAMSSKGLESRQRQAALVMRGFGSNIVMSPANKTSVRSTTPDFSWTPFDGDPPLKIVIFDDVGEQVFTDDVSGSSYKISQDHALTKGNKYSWTVIRKEASTDASSKKQQFKVLTDEQVKMVDDQRPTADSTFADRVLYAGLLEELWLKEEAQALWQTLSSERPNDAFLKKLAEKG